MCQSFSISNFITIFIHASSLQPAGKSTEESSSSRAGDPRSSCKDVPLCISDVYTRHAVEVLTLYVFYHLI